MGKNNKPPRQRPAKVTELRKRDELELDEVPSEKRPRVIRWIVPQAPPPFYAHAHLTDAKLTLCGGHHAIGGVYPPSLELPKCEECERAASRLEKDEGTSTHLRTVQGGNDDASQTEE